MEQFQINTLLGSLNSFDYGFLIFCLIELVHGITQGFRVMLFETVKWVILVAVIWAANALYPYLVTLSAVQSAALSVNEWGFRAALSLITTENRLQALLFTQIARSIPYDKIAFFLLLIAIASIVSRIMILGGLFQREEKQRLLGATFGLLKACVVTFLVMSVLSGFMMGSNRAGFLRWQEESLILSTTGIQFEGERFAKVRDQLVERALERILEEYDRER